jgi:DNA-binding transcriptional regulator WhiA
MSAKTKPSTMVGACLNIKPQTIYDRLRRLQIPTTKEKKVKYLNQRTDITIPTEYSGDLAEFFGIMLGDGHLSHFQVTVTLGSKELAYAEYVAVLMGKVFGPAGTISKLDNGYRTVYIGSVQATRWLQSEGLVSDKVKSQVDAPSWIFENQIYRERFLRGFFDTDGSIYKLKFGMQISLTNYSEPLLASLQRMLLELNYRVSAMSLHRVYITKMGDIVRFFNEIAPKNPKHNERFLGFLAYHESLHR